MDQITTTLSLLRILPDPNRELSAQVLQLRLDTFTCFPKLPPELRDRVYSHTLPGARIINLTPTPLGATDSFKPPPLPQALHICHESRQIALKHYHLIFYGPYTRAVSPKGKGVKSGDSKKCPTPIDKTFKLVMAVDPLIDNIYIRYFDAAENWRSMYREWGRSWRMICKKHENLLCVIKSLEVRGVAWDMDELKDAAYSWVLYSDSPLTYFRGLEELHLIPFKSNQETSEASTTGDYEWPGADDWEMCVGSFHVQFLKFAKDDPTRKIPRVYLHEWRRSQVRTEEENREDGAIDYEISDQSLRNAIGYSDLFNDPDNSDAELESD